MSRKEVLIDKMLGFPKDFSQDDFHELVTIEGTDALNFNDLRECIKRIYDINESSLLNYSDPMNSKMMRWLNKRKQSRRNDAFYNKINNNARKYTKTIVAEGDSWFCFPFYVKDINDWLLEDKRINLLSIAAAGDWMTDMIYEGKYVEELSRIKPDVFLISGGGNDFIGEGRIAYMLDTHYSNAAIPAGASAETCITDEFYAFIHTLKAQYWILFSNIRKSHKFDNMSIITQGYDYAIPTPQNVIRSYNIVQIILNKIAGTGKWLYQSMLMKGLSDKKIQKEIVHIFIDKVNEMFVELAIAKNKDGSHTFPNLYHIDCRGTAKNIDDWFDEIHLKSHRYKEIANKYKKVIFDHPTEKLL